MCFGGVFGGETQKIIVGSIITEQHFLIVLINRKLSFSNNPVAARLAVLLIFLEICFVAYFLTRFFDKNSPRHEKGAQIEGYSLN